MKRLRIAIQKSGRLTDKCLDILDRAGLQFQFSKSRLISPCETFPADLLLVRDDDIPEYLASGTCDLGFVGENLLEERRLERQDTPGFEVISRLGFGKCRLSLATPNDVKDVSLDWYGNKKIATSYPAIVTNYFKERDIPVSVIEVSGSVEITPSLGIADAICDLVSTGSTLKSNGLKEGQVLLRSECVLAQSAVGLQPEQADLVSKLVGRIEGVQLADKTRYVMMNAPKDQVEVICDILPSMEAPSVMELKGQPGKVAIHAACAQDIFWETMEKLKAVGATSVLVLPIEKVI